MNTLRTHSSVSWRGNFLLKETLWLYSLVCIHVLNRDTLEHPTNCKRRFRIPHHSLSLPARLWIKSTPGLCAGDLDGELHRISQLMSPFPRPAWRSRCFCLQEMLTKFQSNKTVHSSSLTWRISFRLTLTWFLTDFSPASTVAASKPSNSRSKVDFPASKLLSYESYEVLRCEVWNVVKYHAFFCQN